MNRLFVFPVITMALFLTGCGLIPLMGTQSQYEKKIPAEYKLSLCRQSRILVLVDQPTWLSAGTNMRYYLTNAIIKELIGKVKFPQENIVTYNQLSEFRANQQDISLLEPQDIAQKLKADLVLFVVIRDMQIQQMTQMGPYAAAMRTQGILIDASTGIKLWPESDAGKPVFAGFDLGPADRELAFSRLAASAAFCNVRYLYDCPKMSFKISDDQSSIAWENLDN